MRRIASPKAATTLAIKHQPTNQSQNKGDDDEGLNASANGGAPRDIKEIEASLDGKYNHSLILAFQPL